MGRVGRPPSVWESYVSFRVKLFTWIVAVNLAVTGLLLWAILGNIRAQGEELRRTGELSTTQRRRILERTQDLLSFQGRMSRQELTEVTPGILLAWDEWNAYEDAIIALNFIIAVDDVGGREVVGEEMASVLNPLGRSRRGPEDRRALSILKEAVTEERVLLRKDPQDSELYYIALPIYLKSDSTGEGLSDRPGPVSGGALVKARIPSVPPPEDRFDWPLFWLALCGGTLALILVTYLILSRLVIRPVEGMAMAADRVAAGDYSVYCASSGREDEIGRLIASFNFMLSEVRDYHKHLEDRVREAQSRMEAAERHLLIAQRLAATGKLAAGIAHEINNPIGGMINAAISLRDRGGREGRAGSALSEERTRLYLELIVEGLERIKDIVRKVLVFTPRNLIPSRISLAEILKDTAALVEHRVRKEEIVLDTHIEPEDLEVFCEPGEIRQVFLNLIINALDAVEPGRGLVEVRGTPDKDGECVVIEIEDNGCGMDETELSHAFDLFYTTKEAGKGTGLGLSLAHSIVVNHGGTMEARSQKGQGTRFRITLPRR